VYTNYVQNYDQALEILNEGKREVKNLEQFLEDCRTSDANPNQFTIDALLILPIQRIPRYDLLLSELIKHTTNDHKDWESLNNARNQMKEVAESVNEAKRGFENRAKVLQIQNSFEGKSESLVDPSRNFIRSDVVAAWSATLDTDKKVLELTVIMFNDIIVVAQPGKKPNMLKFLELIRMNDVMFKETKLRKWRLKMNENGKLWPTSSPSGTASPSESPDTSRRGSLINYMTSVERTTVGNSQQGSPSSTPACTLSEYDTSNSSPSLSSSGGSTNSPASGSPSNRASRVSMAFGSSKRSSRDSLTFSRVNNAELVDAKGETKLKICFESPLEAATWVADFKAAKEKVERITKFQNEKALERAKAKTEGAKKGNSPIYD